MYACIISTESLGQDVINSETEVLAEAELAVYLYLRSMAKFPLCY